MTRVTQRKSTGESGLADVKVNAKSLTLTFKETGNRYEVSKEGQENLKSGQYVVTLNRDGTKLWNVRPLPGATYIARFNQFGNRGQINVPEPAVIKGGPRTRENGQSWYQEDRMVGHALLEIDQPTSIYHGLNILFMMPYRFQLDALRPGFAEITVASKRELSDLEMLFRACGVDLANTDLPFSTNMLPFIEDLLKESDARFQVTINSKGFVDTIAPLPEGLYVRKATPKKAAPKKKK